MPALRRLRPRAAAAALLLAGVAALAAPVVPALPGGRVLAHAQLVASSPAAGAVLAESPPEIRLIFSEPLASDLTSLDVVDTTGTVHMDRAGELDPDDPFALVAADPALPEGVYTVRWRSLSAADGHAAEGFFTFGVGDVADLMPAGSGGAMTHADRELIVLVGRWLVYVGLIGAVGMALFHRLVVRRGPMPRPLVRLVAAGLAVAGVATAVLALKSGLEAGDVGAYLLGGRSGQLQVARAAVTLASAATVLLVPATAAGAVLAAAGLAGIALLVAGGHAAALDDPAAVLAGIVHVTAVAAWVGGLAAMLLLVLRPALLVGSEAPPTLRDAVPRFSAVAIVAIGLVGLSGLYSAWIETGAILPLGTEYGRTLLLKTAAVAGAVAIGAINFLDGGRRPRWLAGVDARLGVEGGLVAVALLLTAALAVTPPTEGSRGVAIEPVPDAFGEVLPNMGMEIAPGRPGVSRITVITTDALAASGGLELTLDRLETGESTRIPLTLAGLEGMGDMEDMDHGGMAERNDDGTIDWYADAVVLPADSSWEASVHILARTTGDELARQRFSFGLDADGVASGEVVTLVTPGSLIAIVLVVAGALGLGLGLGGVALPRCDAAASRAALLVGGTVGVALGLAMGVGGLLA
jgi:putative copper export protein/methionine-rich copper-binding protein CopC